MYICMYVEACMQKHVCIACMHCMYAGMADSAQSDPGRFREDEGLAGEARSTSGAGVAWPPTRMREKPASASRRGACGGRGGGSGEPPGDDDRSGLVFSHAGTMRWGTVGWPPECAA